MTVLTTTSRETKLGNGVTTVFAVSVMFLATSDLHVKRIRASDSAEFTWTEGLQYTLTGAGSSLGGTLTTTAGNTLASGDQLLIDRQVPSTQLVDLVPNSALPADTLEHALDKLTMICQELEYTDDRSLRLDPFDPATGIDALPLKTALASKFLAFDGDGNPIAAAGTSANLGPVSAFMDTLLDDADAAAARVTLGVESYGTSVKLFGATGDGVTDDTSAIQDTIATVAAQGGGIVYLPAGTYLTSAALTVTAAGVHILGEGQTATVIRNTNTTANVFTFGPTIDFVSIRDLTIEPSVTVTAGAAIATTGAVNIFLVDRVRIKGGFKGINLQGAGLAHRIDNCYLHELDDACITVGGAGAANFMQDVFISRTNTSGGTSGLAILNGSGVYVSQCDFVLSTSDGILMFPAAGDVAIFSFFQSVLADTSGDNGWNINSNGGRTGNVSCVACWSAGANNHGILVDSANVDGFSFVGGEIRNSGKNGVLLNAGKGVLIGGNQIYHNSLDGSGSFHGISVTAGFEEFAIKGNSIGTGGYDRLAGGPNFQGYGINLNSSAATKKFVVEGNILNGNVTGGMADSTSTTNKHIGANIGYVGKNSGTATMLIGNAAVAVTHGLGGTPAPSSIQVVSLSNPVTSGVSGAYWISAIGATTFTINADNIIATANLSLGWSASLANNY